MIAMINCLIGVLSLGVLIPAALLFLEVLASSGPKHGATAKQTSGSGHRPRLAVVVPAHNEAKMIADTLRSILAELVPGDRLLLIADNCTDDTAVIAAAAGAEVIERHNLREVGKGFALDLGLRHLADTGAPEVVLLVDADCQISPGSFNALATLSHETGRPAQGSYLLHADGARGLGIRFSEFAIRVKNHVRPDGSRTLGIPCPLTGSGMAFPWKLVAFIHLGTANIVEDMALGLDLSLAGFPPLFCPEAVITSPLPTADSSQLSQRKRWEGGHLAMLRRFAPILAVAALRQRRPLLLAVALDLCIPPLALLAILIAGLIVAGGLWSLLGGTIFALHIAMVALALLLGAVLLAWGKAGRDLISLWEMAYIPVYILRKVSIYVGVLLGRKIGWVRSDRN